MIRRSKLFTGLMLAGVLGFAGNAMAAKLTIINKDAANQGLNDPSPATPVGGNAGVTRGEQARIVFEFAANLWGAVLQSDGPIDIDAKFSALQCNDSGIILGSTGTGGYARFPIAGQTPPNAKVDLWYPGSLVNALIGGDNSSTSEMTMSFNGALGTASCLPDGGWYFGLDGETPDGKNNLLNVMLHEMGHGLGFAGRTSLTSGQYSGGFNDIYSSFVYDNSNNKAWADLTPAQRVASAKKDGMLVFRGPNVVAEAPLALGPPPVLKAETPAGPVGDFVYAPAAFGPAPTPQNFAGAVAVAVTGANSQACEPFDNASAMVGRVAIVDRGTCSFQLKTVNAEAAGATAVIIANNVEGVLNAGGDAAYATPTIPTVVIGLSQGNALKAAAADATVTLGFGTGLSGTDAAGNVQIYAPTVLAQGSSFSHYDTRLSPNALMEYAESSDLQGHINLDLTPALYKDEGWLLNEGGQMLLTCNTGVPTWVPGGLIIGANVYASAKNYAASATHFGVYRTDMQAYAADLAAKELITAGQASSLNACLTDAELRNQFNAWGNGEDEPVDPGDDPVAVALTNGVALGGNSGAVGEELLFKIDVPAGARALVMRTSGGIGDVSMLVKVDGEPTATDKDYSSARIGNAESVSVSRPVEGTYFIKVVGVKAFSGVTVQANFVVM